MKSAQEVGGVEAAVAGLGAAINLNQYSRLGLAELVESTVGDKLVLVSFFLFKNPIPGTGKSNNVGTRWHSSVNKRCLIRLSCRNQSFSSFLSSRSNMTVLNLKQSGLS